MPGIAVLCPLAIEASAAAKGIGRRAEIRVSGPGARAIAQAVRRAAHEAFAGVILFGVAGALTARARSGGVVSRVITQDGAELIPTLNVDRADPGLTLASVEKPVGDPASRAHLAEKTGACLVDLESVAFAETAAECGIPWAIARGVSDGPGDRLPADIEDWVSPSGSARVGRICLSCIRHPSHLVMAIRLASRSREGLKVAAGALQRLLEAGVAV